MVLGSAPQMKNSGCLHVVCEAQSEDEGRVGHQASNIENWTWSIVNIKYSHGRNMDCKSVYNILMISDCKSVATILEIK